MRRGVPHAQDALHIGACSGYVPAMSRDQRVRDPVHGLITFRADSPLDQLAWSLLDTPAFQRLRRIRQLGVSEFVFPSATHTRFAHCIGVFHTARQLIEVIRRELKRQGEVLNRERAEVAVIAALLHDVGHGPFSHTFEGVQKARKVEKRHELWTADIIRAPIAGVAPLLSGYRGDGRFGEEVADLLEAEDPIDLYHAVVSSSFDADRLDYLRRDRLMTGSAAGAIDFDWLMEHVRVSPVDLEAPDLADLHEQAPATVPTFCLDLKALPAAEQFLLARYTLHEQVYFHKTTRCVEHLIARLLGRVAELAQSEAADAGQVGLTSDHPLWRFFSTVEPAVEDYLALDDVILMGALEPMSRAADGLVCDLARRLRERRFYKTLDLTYFGHDEGRLAMAARVLDRKRKEGGFTGAVIKDEGASFGLYTEIGGDDDKIHKKLHIVDAQGAQEVSRHSRLIRALADAGKRRLTRYYFEIESDRDAARAIMRREPA